MRSLLLSFILLLQLAVASGCSMLIASGDRPEPRFTVRDMRETVRKELGLPVAMHTYRPPLPLEIPPWRVEKVTIHAAFREDYLVQRWLEESGPGTAMGFGMWASSTFFISEIVCIPAAIEYASERRRDVHRFRVWYSADGHYLFHDRRWE